MMNKRKQVKAMGQGLEKARMTVVLVLVVVLCSLLACGGSDIEQFNEFHVNDRDSGQLAENVVGETEAPKREAPMPDNNLRDKGGAPDFSRKPEREKQIVHETSRERFANEVEGSILDEPHLPEKLVDPEKAIKETKVPESPRCYSLGQRYQPNGKLSCCPGLTSGSFGTLPRCESTLKICVLCGDGMCDTQNGETPCNCAKDCKVPECKKDSDCGKKSCKQRNRTCEQKRPTCTRGSCSTGGKSVSNATCDTKRGECVATPACTSDSDCGRPSCSGNGVCLQSTPRCQNTMCTHVKSQISNANCDKSTGICKIYIPECKRACDCKQGQSCVQGKCLNTPTPVYCCDKAKCPQGKACIDKSGKKGSCPKPKCTKASDCGKPGCRNSGTSCIQLTHACHQGSCSSTSRSMAHALCEASTGTCKSRGPICKGDSDCKSTCKHDAKICAQTRSLCKNGYCTQESPKLFRNRICNATKGLCESKKCGPGLPCRFAHFCESKGKNCIMNTPICYQNECLTSRKTYYDHICTSNRCLKRCSSAKDCKKNSCRQYGVDCLESVRSCSKNNTCQVKTTTVSKAICNTRTGTCFKTTTCGTSKDCPPLCKQSSYAICSQDTQRCIGGLCWPGFYKDHENKFCGTTGTCGSKQCKVAQDCGKTYCIQQKSGCHELKPQCQGKNCHFAITKYTTSLRSCHKSSGKCLSQKCRLTSECGGYTCTNQGDNCIQRSSSCTSGWCRTTLTSRPKYRCGNNGICFQPCKSSSDCPRENCSQGTRRCYRRYFTCEKGVCKANLTTYIGKSCSSSGRCY